MIKGLYSAVSAMLAGINRQQSLAHNVANLDTPGFKQVLTSLDDFMHTIVLNPPANLTGQPAVTVGMLGLGVESSPDMTDFSQGGLENTSNPLDMAIDGSGFFRISTPDGERYTRDGRFVRDAEGSLVTVDGFSVLGVDGQPIELPEGDVTVDPDGAMRINEETVGQIGLAVFENPQAQLVRDGDNLYRATVDPATEGGGSVRQNVLEMSNANPSEIMTQMVEIARYYQAAQQMVQNQDELLGKTISTLGRTG